MRYAAWREASAGECRRSSAGSDGSADKRELIAEGVLLRAAERFRVLGQVTRLRLLEQLMAGPATGQELADSLGLSQQNVSKQLGVLHRSGVLSRRPEGVNVFYAVADDSTAAVVDDVVASVMVHLRELSGVAVVTPDVRAEGTVLGAAPR